MRVLVMGAGALGGYFGARLQASGHEVIFVARGAHLEAIRARGVVVESPKGNLTLPNVIATDDPAQAGGAVDLILFMVKTYDVESALAALEPVIGPDTRLLTVQNGVSTQERVARRLGTARVYPGAVYMPADIRVPGVIRHSSDFDRLEFGSVDPSEGDRLSELLAMFRAAGLQASLHPDPQAMLWEKFVVMAATSSMCALTRLDMGPIRDTPETRTLLRRAIDETFAVARASHAGVAPDAAERAFHLLTEVAPATMHASMLDDLNRGKRLELRDLSGDILRRARSLGIAVPFHEMAYAALLPYADGAPVS